LIIKIVDPPPFGKEDLAIEFTEKSGERFSALCALCGEFVIWRLRAVNARIA